MNQSQVLDILFFNGEGETDDEKKLARLLHQLHNLARTRARGVRIEFDNKPGAITIVVSVQDKHGAIFDRVSQTVTVGKWPPEQVEQVLLDALIVSCGIIIEKVQSLPEQAYPFPITPDNDDSHTEIKRWMR